jgi:hypothetical protein
MLSPELVLRLFKYRSGGGKWSRTPHSSGELAGRLCTSVALVRAACLARRKVGCRDDFLAANTAGPTSNVPSPTAYIDESGMHYVHFDTPMFTRHDVDVVRIGGRVENGPGACTATDQVVHEVVTGFGRIS